MTRALCGAMVRGILLVLASAVVMSSLGCGAAANTSSSSSGSTSNVPLFTATNFYIEDSLLNNYYTSAMQAYAMKSVTTSAVSSPVYYANDTTSSDFGPMRFDALGNLYIANDYYSGGNTTMMVNVYPPGQVQSSGLITNYTFTPSILTPSSGIAIDAGNYFYTTANGTLYQFNAAKAGAKPTPNWTLQVCTGVSLTAYEALVIDSAGNTYMLCGNSIYVFAPGIGSKSTPARVINLSQTPIALSDMAVDASQNVYVLTQVGAASSVNVYSGSQSGAAVPARVISGSATKLNVPTGVAVDSGGTLYVSDTDSSGNRIVYCFAPGASGDIAPFFIFDSNSQTRGGINGTILVQ